MRLDYHHTILELGICCTIDNSKRRSSTSNCSSNSALLGNTSIPAELGTTVTGAIYNLDQRTPEEKEWTYVTSGNGTKAFDASLYDWILCNWMNGNNDTMSSTMCSLKWFTSTTPIVRMYAGTTTCPVARFNFTAKTVNLDMQSQSGRIDIFAWI